MSAERAQDIMEDFADVPTLQWFLEHIVSVLVWQTRKHVEYRDQSTSFCEYLSIAHAVLSTQILN